MATQKRNVKRGNMADGHMLALASSKRKSYEIPDWLKEMIADNLGWVALAAGLIMAVPATLAIVLGFHALPLELIGVPSSDNSVGINIIAPILVATLLLLAAQPLRRREMKGWRYAGLASLIYTINQIYLGHGISSIFLALVTLYLYIQTRRRFS